jgi:hypothetical protein
MRILKSLATRVLAVALAFSVVPAAIPANVPVVGISKAEARDRGGPPRWHRGNLHRGGRDYRGGRRHYRGGRYYGNNRRYYNRRHRNNSGAVIGGAILGLGLGAAIANSNQPRAYRGGSYAVRSQAWYDSCSARYRSFDPRSGTYQPNNGPRRMCR